MLPDERMEDRLVVVEEHRVLLRSRLKIPLRSAGSACSRRLIAWSLASPLGRQCKDGSGGPPVSRKG